MLGNGEFTFQQRRPGVWGMGNPAGEGSAVGADFLRAACFGLIPGIIPYITEGHNEDIDTASPEDIWDNGGSMQYLSSAEVMHLVSTDANDTAAGSGLQQVMIDYLDSNWSFKTANFELNGLTPVVLPAGVRCLKVRGIRGAVNVGIITVTASISGYVMGYIKAGQGLSHQSHFTVPANREAIVLRSEFRAAKIVGGSPLVNFKGYGRLFGGPWVEEFETFIDTGLNTVEVVDENIGDLFPAKTDFRVLASTDLNDTQCRCRLYILMRELQ